MSITSVIAEAKDKVAQPGLEAMLEALSSHGIAAASEDQPPLQADFLGFRLDCRKKTWLLHPHKLWVLTRAQDATQEQGFRCTGREVERLLGHIVHAFMLRRELLALLHEMRSGRCLQLGHGESSLLEFTRSCAWQCKLVRVLGQDGFQSHIQFQHQLDSLMEFRGGVRTSSPQGEQYRSKMSNFSSLSSQFGVACLSHKHA